MFWWIVKINFFVFLNIIIREVVLVVKVWLLNRCDWLMVFDGV